MRQKLTMMGAIMALCVFTGMMLCANKSRAAALSDGLAPTKLSADEFPARMYAGVIYRGGLVAISNGVAYPAENNAEYRVLGVAGETVDNTVGAADYSATRRCVIRQGIFLFANTRTGTDASTNAVYSLAVSDVGKPAYVVDDQTVGASSNGLYTVAGTVAYVEPDAKFVWVDVGKAWSGSVALQPYKIPSAATGLASGRLYTSAATNVVFVVP